MSSQRTSHESKKVMMRAEHRDEINVETLGLCEVVQRIHTYYGPKLRIEPITEERSKQYILHAPGPRSELQLSSVSGKELRNVSAEIEDVKQYDICLECGEPLKTTEHRRESVIGACTGDA